MGQVISKFWELLSSNSCLPQNSHGGITNSPIYITNNGTAMKVVVNCNGVNSSQQPEDDSADELD